MKGRIFKGKIIKFLIYTFATLVLVPILLVFVSYPGFKSDMQLASERISRDSKILQTDKYTIEYAIKGEGIPVLSLHGAGGGYDQGLLLGKLFLDKGYKLISVSRFGYLNSSLSPGASIKSQAEVYKILLNQLDIDSAIVIGGSAGGPSAMQFANDYPDRTRLLILLSAVSMVDHSLDELPTQVQIIHLVQKFDYTYWLSTRLLQSTVLDLVGMPPAVYQNFTSKEKEMAQEILGTMHPASQRISGTYNDNVMIQDFDLKTLKLSTPTLIVHAKDDALVGYHHAMHTHQNINQSELVLFEDGGHALITRTNDIRKAIKYFILENTQS